MAVSDKPATAAAADSVPAADPAGPAAADAAESYSADPTEPYSADAAGLFVAMARLNRLVRRKAPAQLGHSAVAALATVVWFGPLRPSDLAAREGVSAPTMTRVLSGLEAGGYAVREPDPADGRASLVRATAEGVALIQGNRSARSRVLRERIAALTEEQRAALRAALPALRALTGDD